MRTLVGALILLAGTVAAGERGDVPPIPEPEARAGSSTMPKPLAAPSENMSGSSAAGSLADPQDSERRRRLMMLLMMRDAAQAFPSLLMRAPE